MRKLQNSVQLAGRLLEDPALQQLSDGSYVANLKLALFDRQSEADGSARLAIFHLVAWDGLAQAMEQAFKKGSRLLVRGSLQNRKVQRQGMAYDRAEILIHEYLALGPNNSALQNVKADEPS